MSTKKRVIAYIDGFNLYYGIRAASRDSDRLWLINGGDPSQCLGRSLYWLDVRKLVLSQLQKHQELAAIKYFSAPRIVPKRVVVNPDEFVESNERQRLYLEGIRTLAQVEVVLGWYAEKDPWRCECGIQTPVFEEKVTDVNIAVHLLEDAYHDRYDQAMVLSADADLVPAVQAAKRAGKEVILVLPPGRKRAQHLRNVASHTRNIKIRSVRQMLLPERIDAGHGRTIACPVRWLPTGSWVWGEDWRREGTSNNPSPGQSDAG